MQRPLTDEYLEYAASDVLLIHALYNHFIENKFIDLATLPSQSMRYVSMWRNNQPKSDDIYAGHPLLPLGILREPSSPTAECIHCKRTLSQDAISSKEYSNCWVCRAITIIVRLRQRWEREDDAYYGRGGYLDRTMCF